VGRGGGGLIKTTHVTNFILLKKDDSFVKILETYVNYLINNEYKELIAFYLSNLPSEYQIRIYSKFLESN
jgi:hypothetical protein